jgi:hypothetical protein
METNSLKSCLCPISSIGLFLFLIFASILVVLDSNFQEIYAKKDTNDPCPQTMSMGATYVDKHGCIQPCPTTSPSQSEVPAGCPQQPSDQSGQQQQQQQQQQQPSNQEKQQKSDQSIQPSAQQQKLSSTSDQALQQQQPSQSMQQQLPPPQQQLGQNSPTNLNNLNTLGPLGTEANNRINEKLSPCANDLTGKWIANDGGVYYIKQDGNKIRWFGSTLFNDDAIKSHTGFEYANEALGDITNSNNGNGTQIHLTWDDVFISNNHLKGTLDLSVYPSGSKMVTISANGGFGPSEWTRKC